MNKFQELYSRLILLTEDIMGIGSSKLKGMHTSVQNLPDYVPYGFWVDRHGNFAIVQYQQHWEVAADLVKQACDQTNTPPPDKDPYDILFKDGWMRVVCHPHSKTIYYQFSPPSREPSHGQNRFLNFIKDFYEMEQITSR